MNSANIEEEVDKLVNNNVSVTVAFSQVARELNLTVGSVRNRYYRQGGGGENLGNRSLTPDQEKQVLYSVLGVSQVDMDWTAKQTQQMIRSVFGVTISSNWVRRFNDRHKNLLSSRETTPLGEKRSNPGCLDAVKGFVDSVEKFLQEFPIAARQVVNYDESRITIRSDGKLRLKRLVSREKKKAQHRPSAACSHCGTIIPFVSADGKCLKVYFILSHKFKEKSEDVINFSLPVKYYRTRGNRVPYEIIWNDSGYVNNANWKTIGDDFGELWTTLYPGLVCFCVGDNLSSHRQRTVLEDGLAKNIYYWFLVQHTTHWSQPLDNLLFAVLKKALYRLLGEIYYEKVFVQKTVVSLLSISLEAVNLAFQPKTIKKAFAEVGLWPFSREKILALAEEHHGSRANAYTPTTHDQYIVQQTTEGVHFVFEEIQRKGEARENKRRRISGSFEKGKLLDPRDIILYHQAQ